MPDQFSQDEFLSTHRVCGPPVKRCELGAMPRGGAISRTERVRPVEDAVLKTVALAMVSKVRVLGAPLFHVPVAQQTESDPLLEDQMRVRLSPGTLTPAWCNSSTLGSQPGNLGALPSAGAIFIRPIVQKENGRPTPGRPWSITTSGDHSSFLRSSKAEPPPDKRKMAV